MGKMTNWKKIQRIFRKIKFEIGFTQSARRNENYISNREEKNETEKSEFLFNRKQKYKIYFGFQTTSNKKTINK